MSVWHDIDRAVALHQARLKELRSLAREGNTFRAPRNPNGLWVLRTRSGVEPKAEHFVASFDDAKAILEVDAKRLRALRAARAEEKRKAREAKAAEAAARKANQKKRGG